MFIKQVQEKEDYWEESRDSVFDNLITLPDFKVEIGW